MRGNCSIACSCCHASWFAWSREAVGVCVPNRMHPTACSLDYHSTYHVRDQPPRRLQFLGDSSIAWGYPWKKSACRAHSAICEPRTNESDSLDAATHHEVLPQWIFKCQGFFHCQAMPRFAIQCVKSTRRLHQFRKGGSVFELISLWTGPDMAITEQACAA